MDDRPPQRADAGVRLPAIAGRVRGLGRCTPAKMEPGCQRVAAALLIKTTLRQAQAQWRVQPPLRFTADGVTGARPVLRLDESKTSVEAGVADPEGLTPQR